MGTFNYGFLTFLLAYTISQSQLVEGYLGNQILQSAVVYLFSI